MTNASSLFSVSIGEGPSSFQELDALPSSFEIKRLRDCFVFSKGLTITKEDLEDEGVPCMNYGEVHSKYPVRFAPSKNPLQCVDEEYLKSDAKSLLQVGDIVFADTSEDIDGSGNFSQLDAEETVFAGYHTVIARPKVSCNLRYLSYVLDSVTFRKQIQQSVNGVKVYSITQAILKNAFLWLPPESEQSKVVAFLDKKTSKLDEAIDIKEKQIKLLKEHQEILIQNAVTRGLNPDVSMKDSGVDWLGRIPAHWEAKRAKYYFVEIDERSENGEEELLSVSHMTGVTPRSEKKVSMFMAEDYSGSKLCRNGDLVINIMWAWMGALGVSFMTGIVSPSYGVFRQASNRAFNSTYIEWLLKTTQYIQHYNRVSTGLHSSRLRFYAHLFMDMTLIAPPVEEQDQIVDEIIKRNGVIERAIEANLKQIEKLKEYKASLIDSAATGRIKVA